MEFSIKHACQMMVTLVVCLFVLNELNIFTRNTAVNDLNETSTLNKYSIQNSSIELNVEPIALTLNQSYDLKEYVKAKDSQFGDITDTVKIYDDVDITKKGFYQVRYEVMNQYGQRKDKYVRAKVDE